MWQKAVKKTVFTVCVDNYAPELTALTFPFIQRWAKKIGADFHVITERKFPHLPPPCEKLQIYTLGQQMENDWNIYLDADAFIHPEAPDFTLLVGKNTVMHHGRDFAPIRWKCDRYFWRDGRCIGSANWCTMASDQCIDLWHPIEDLTLDEILTNINPTPKEIMAGVNALHLIDDYTLSRNIAMYGLKCTTILEQHEKMGLSQSQCFFWHEYLIPLEEKIKQIKRIAGHFSSIFPSGELPIAQPENKPQEPSLPQAGDVDRVEVEQWNTPRFGKFWSVRGDRSFRSVVEELESKLYGDIKPGEIVLDCGAYVGVFARTAIFANADTVISVEPWQWSAACFERNLDVEIRTGKVILAKVGLWDTETEREMSVDPSWVTQSSMFIERAGGHKVKVPVTTIDQLMARLPFERLDFIKMDIEGSEMPALVGAINTLTAFHPRLAIAVEHFVGDAEAIREKLEEMCPGVYQFTEKNKVLHCTPTLKVVDPAAEPAETAA